MNAVVAIHRKKFPDDPRSDRDLTLDYATTYGEDFFKDYPDFQADFKKISGAEPAPPVLTEEESAALLRELYPPTAVDYVKQATGEIIRSGASMVATVPENIAIGAREMERAFTGEEPTPLAELDTYKFAQSVKRAGDAVSPDPVPGLEDSFLSTTVPRALGSAASFMAGGIAGKAIGIPRTLGIAGVGATANAAGAYEEAKKAGATDEQAFEAYLLNAGVGTSEVLPLARILKRLDGVSGGTLRKAIVNAGRDSFEESLQEALQGTAGNYIAKNIVQYDTDREIFEGVATQGGAGGVVGAIVSLVTSAIGGKVGAQRQGREQSEAAGRKQLDGRKPAAPVSAETEELLAQYRTEPEKVQFQDDQMRELAGRELGGALSADDTIALSKMTQEQDRSYRAIREQLRKENENATNQGIVEEGGIDERVGDDAQLRSEEENRQREAALQRAREEGGRGDSIEVGGQVAPPALAPDSPVQSVPIAPVPAVPPPEPAAPLPTTTGKARAVASQLVLTPRKKAKAINPEPHEIVEEIDWEGQPLTEEESAQGSTARRALMPAYFEIPEGATNYEPLVSRASFAGKVEKGSRNTWTHRFTAFLKGDRVFILPTYKDDKGVIRTVLPAATKGTPMAGAVEQGYKPLSSLRRKEALHAIDAPKISMSRAEFDRRVAKPSLERLSAIKSTASQVESGMEPGTDVIRDSDLEMSPAAAEEVHTALTAALAGQPEGTLTEESASSALADYITKGKYANELKGIIGDLARRVGASGATRLFLSRIVETYNNSSTSQGFVETISGRTAAQRANRGVGGQDLAPGDSGPRHGQPPISVSTASPDGAMAARAAKLRLGQGSYTRGDRITSSFRYVLDRLAMAGVNIQVFQQRWDQDSDEFFRSAASGLLHNNNTVALVVNDLTAPTRGELVAAIHEVAHIVFANESQEMQQRIHRAINRMSDAQLGLEASGDVRIRAENAAKFNPETLAEERGVESLALEGFDPIAARSIWRRILRYLQDIYNRASIWVQEALFGPNNVNPDRVRDYFRIRLQSFLAGDPTPMDFLSFLGGGRPSSVRQATFYKPWNELYVPVVLDWESGSVEHTDFSPSTVAAVLHNIENALRDARTKFTKPYGVAERQPIGGENATVRASLDFAADKKVSEVLQQAFAAFDSTGGNVTSTGKPMLSYESFVQLFQDKLDAPEAMMAATQMKLEQVGEQPINTDLSIDGPVTFNNDASKKQSLAKALKALNEWKSNLVRTYTDARRRKDSNQRKLERKISRVEELSDKYSDLELHFAHVKEALTGLIEEFKSDLRTHVNQGKSLGVLTQMVKQTQARMDDPIPPQYENVIERMSKRILNHEVAFMDFLRTASQLPIQWDSLTLFQIRDSLRNVMNGNEVFQGLDETEQNALVALAAAFGRSNDHQMALLQIREANDAQAAQALREVMRAARSDTTADLNEAKKLVPRVGRLADQARRVLDRYLQMRMESRVLLDEQQRINTTLGAYAAFYPIVQQQIGKMERALGAAIHTPLVEGARLPRISSPDDTVEIIQKNEPWVYRLTGDGAATQKEVSEMIRRYQEWIDANETTGGAMVNTLKTLVRRLEMVDANKLQIGKRQGIVAHVLGSLGDIAQGTGTIAGNRIAQRLRRYSFLNGTFVSEREAKGFQIARAMGEAMSALGVKDRDTFMSIFHDQAFDYINKRRDLQEVEGGPQAAENAAFNALRNHYLSDPNLRESVNRGWDKLRKFLEMSVRESEQYDRMARKQEFGQKIKDDNLGVIRDTIGQAVFTMPRGLNEQIEYLFGKMRESWNGTRSPKIKAADIAARFAEDPEQLRGQLQERFKPEVWRLFAGEMAKEDGRAIFSGRQFSDGTYALANTENVQRAYQDSNGDPLLFAMSLHQREGGTPETLPDFVGETLETFQNYFDLIERIMAESEAFKNNMGQQVGVPRYLMDARVSESMPAGWLRHHRFDQNHARATVHRMAFHAAFGRNAEELAADFAAAERELNAGALDWDTIQNEIKRSKLSVSKKEVKRLARAEASKRGLNLKFIENAESNLRSLHTTRDQFAAWFKAVNDDLLEAKAVLEGLSLVTGLMVQGPKTALINTNDMVAGPIAQLGLSKQALNQIRRNWSSFFNGVFGSLFQTIGIQLNRNSDSTRRYNDLGFRDTDSYITAKDRIKGEITGEIQGGAGTQSVVRAARLGRALTRAGLPSRTGETLFPEFTPQALFTWFARLMHMATIQGSWGTFSDAVGRAVEYYRMHPEAIEDPDFRFHAEHLGYKSGVLIDDARAFEAIKEGLNRWGMTLEGMARNSVKDGAPLMTDEQWRAIGQMGLSEINLESDINTSPRWAGNPIMKFAMPLLRWSFAKTEQLRKTFREPNGEASWYGVANGIKAIATLMPLGLAYALLMDKYDEKLTGKKSNIRGFGQDNNFLALLEQTARIGTLGLWGDLGNTIGNYAGQGDLRGLSVDNRVVIMNSLVSLMNGLSTAIHQGDATYATVYRPMLQALGGSGYMQYAQILNNFTTPEFREGVPLIGGVLEEERRVTSRINVNNWLRAVGREMNLGVRIGRAGAAVIPNSIKPWIGEMVLSAMADDHSGFQEARRRAEDAAREEGKEDPEKHVRLSYIAYNPLRTVFQPPPTESEYAQLLNRLPESGRRAVLDAINLFNRYAEIIGANTYEGRVEEKPNQRNQPKSLGASRQSSDDFSKRIRRQALNRVLSYR